MCALSYSDVKSAIATVLQFKRKSRGDVMLSGYGYAYHATCNIQFQLETLQLKPLEVEISKNQDGYEVMLLLLERPHYFCRRES